MKFLLGVIVVLSLICAFLGYKTYDLSEENATLGASLTQALDKLDDTSKALEKQVLSCSLTDTINTEYQNEKKEHEDKTKGIVEQIITLPPTKALSPPIKQSSDSGAPNEDVNLDAPLPAELRMLLDKACNPNKDGVCVYAK